MCYNYGICCIYVAKLETRFGVRCKGIVHIVGHLLNITVGLTTSDPRINRPLNSPFWKCATYDKPKKGVPIDLKCDEPLHEGRYLFVAATVNNYFCLNEVEVYTGNLWNGGHCYYYRRYRPERYCCSIIHASIVQARTQNFMKGGSKWKYSN